MNEKKTTFEKEAIAKSAAKNNNDKREGEKRNRIIQESSERK